MVDHTLYQRDVQWESNLNQPRLHGRLWFIHSSDFMLLGDVLTTDCQFVSAIPKDKHAAYNKCLSTIYHLG